MKNFFLSLPIGKSLEELFALNKDLQEQNGESKYYIARIIYRFCFEFWSYSFENIYYFY